jgi:hypothetical protein
MPGNLLWVQPRENGGDAQRFADCLQNVTPYFWYMFANVSKNDRLHAFFNVEV